MRRLGQEQLATLLLLSVTTIWGSTFFLIRDLVAHVPPADFLGVRFAIAAVALFVLFRRQTLALSRRELRIGVLLGVLYGVAQLLQTMGLQSTDASVSGFITGTYVVLTPVLGAALLRDRIPRQTWVAVALATAGLALISLRGSSVGLGELLTLGCAAVYALHIIGLGRWSTPRAAVGLATVQAGVIAVVCLAGSLPGGIALPATGAQWANLLYMALVAGALALVTRKVPARAALMATVTAAAAAALGAAALAGESPAAVGSA